MKWNQDYLLPLFILFGVLLFPVWGPILANVNIKKCPHFFTDCPGSYALNKQCGIYNAKHNCLHYRSLEKQNTHQVARTLQ